jgi:ArsR family transcriptional regulator
MTDEELVQVAKALADPTRFGVLREIVAAGEVSCGELAERVAVGQPTVSHHVRILAECGLIDTRRSGQYSFYTARVETLDGYRRGLEAAFGTPTGLPDLGWGVID